MLMRLGLIIALTTTSIGLSYSVTEARLGQIGGDVNETSDWVNENIYNVLQAALKKDPNPRPGLVTPAPLPRKSTSLDTGNDVIIKPATDPKLEAKALLGLINIGFEEIWKQLVSEIKILKGDIRVLIARIFNRNPNEILTAEEGLIVFPATSDPALDKKTIARLKEVFSDETIITPNVDGTSGTIRPVFRDGEAEDYLYLVVPIKR